MSNFAFFGSAAAVNPDDTYEFVGYAATTGTAITAGTSSAKGAWVELTGGVGAGIAVDWAELIVLIGSGPVRCSVDIATANNGTGIIIADLHAEPGGGTTGSWVSYKLPIKVAAGTRLWARHAASVNSQVGHVAIAGVPRTVNSAPGFSSMVNIAGISGTLAGPTDIPLRASGTGTWTALVTTSAAYGAIMAVMSENGSTPAAAQDVMCKVATGAAGSEVTILQWGAYLTTTGALARNGRSPLLGKSLPSGTPLSANIQAGTPGSDNARMSLYGFIA